MVGLTLPQFAEGHDSPNVARSFWAGLSALQHSFDVRGRPIHHAIGIIPVAASQLSAKDYPLPCLGAVHPLKVEGDTSAIAATGEVDCSRVLAPNSVALPFKLVRRKLRGADRSLPAAKILLCKAMQAPQVPAQWC